MAVRPPAGEGMGGMSSRKVIVLGGKARRGDPVVQKDEQTRLGGQGLLEEFALDRVGHCGCGRAIRSVEEAAGICVAGHVLCPTCAQGVCVDCGRTVCTADRARSNQILCTPCATRRLLIGGGAFVLLILFLVAALRFL